MAKQKKTPTISNDAATDMKDRVKELIASINQHFGAGTMTELGDNKPVPIPRVSSGSINLNDAIGGGFPRGRIIEIIGPESSGKTTVALHAVAELQKEAKAKGKRVLYIDAEHALDINYAQALGVDIKELIFSQPNTAEDALQIAEIATKSGIIEGFVIDSVAALVPRAELEGEIGDSHIGLLARLMSQAMRKLAGVISKSDVVAIFINQIREKVGVMFGSPETTPGGRALKFYSSVRLDIRTMEVVKKNDFPILKKTKITVIKSKVSTPHRVVIVDVEFGKGISRAGEVIDYAVDLGLMAKSGAWYQYRDNRFQGRDTMKEFLESNPILLEELFSIISDMMTPDYEELPEQETGEMPVEDSIASALALEE